jgi:hypothetical protein
MRSYYRPILILLLLPFCVGASPGTDDKNPPPPSNPPAWEFMGRGINLKKEAKFSYVDASPHGFAPVVASTPDTVYVAYSEFNIRGITEIRVKHWLKDAWSRKYVVLNKDGTLNAYDPTTAVLNETPYVAWTEKNNDGIPQLQMTYRSPVGWIPSKGSRNVNPKVRASSPVMAAGPDRILLTWTEGAENAVQKLYLREILPDRVGDASEPLNKEASRDVYEPSIAVDGKTAYLAWAERDMFSRMQIYVRRIEDGASAMLGDTVNINGNAHAVSPSIAVYKGTPYVTWVEFDEGGISQVFIKHWEKNRWVTNGRSMNADPTHDALSPKLIAGKDSLFLAWSELADDKTPRVHVRRLKDQNWSSAAPDLPPDSSHMAATPALTFDRGNLLVAWKQDNPMGVFEIHVGRLKDSP